MKHPPIAIPLLFAAAVFLPMQPLGAQQSPPPSIPLWSTAPAPFSEFTHNIARATAQNDASKVQLLVADGESPNDIDDHGRTGLEIAAMNGNLSIMAILIKAGGKVNATDELGDTPLHAAIARDQTEAAEFLIRAGAPVDAQNRQGLTPLMVAARQGELDMVRLLLGQGAKVDKTDYTGRDALGWAAQGHSQAVAAALKRAGADKEE